MSITELGKRLQNQRAGVLLCLVFFAPSALRAEQLPIKTYTTADGLPRNQINRIVRDSRGFLWFCTAEGLSRFDGNQFTNYGKAQGLLSSDVEDLLETHDDIYWVGTSEGLYRFDPRPSPGEAMFAPYYLNDERKQYRVMTLLEDHEGAIWCGTVGGVYELKRSGDQWVLRFVEMGMPAGYSESLVQTLREDRRGSLWVGTQGSGLYRRLPDGQIEHYTTRHGLLSNDIPTLLVDREGRLWVGTSAGLCLLVDNPNSHQSIVARTFTKKDGLPGDKVDALFQSADGRLWLGMFGGLSSFVFTGIESAPQIRSYTTRNGLTDIGVTAIADDREGNLWLGNNAALKISRDGFTTYREEDGLGTSRIASIFAGRDGQVYAVSSGIEKRFINQFDGKRFAAVVPNPAGQIKVWGWGWNQITFQDHTGEWWVTTGQGLVRFPKVSRAEELAHVTPKAFYRKLGDRAFDEAFRLYEDARGDIWVSATSASEHWISRWERATESFHNYSAADGLPGGETGMGMLATAFCEDRASDLWVGFNGPTLARFREGRFTTFTANDGVPASWIRALHPDHAGRLWVASSRQGVSRIDDPTSERPRFINYSTRNGLSSDSAWCVTEDNWNRIYVGTGRGVDRLDPETGRIKHFTEADGLARGEVEESFSDRHGTLWFGTDLGLSRLIPESDRPQSPPPILISGLRVVGSAHPLSELGESEVRPLELAPDRNQLQIDFVGLDFGAGETRYQYKLEGADQDWSAPSSQRTVNYASLRPGRYRFLVRGVTSDGTVSQSPAVVAFTVLPPIWQRWWFVLLVALAVGTIVYRLYRYRVARLLELERVRTRIATDLHDDIGSSLSQVSVLSEVIRRRVGHEESVSEPLSTIATLSRDLVDSMNDIVWAINPKRDRLSDLTQRMRRFASDVFTARDIEFSFRAPDPQQDIRLGADMRREVFLIFKETINNIVRHSACTEAEITFSIANGSLELKLCDNGRGFDPEQASDGNGLTSIRRRAAKLRGTLEIVSNDGGGTAVNLKAPLGQRGLRWS